VGGLGGVGGFLGQPHPLGQNLGITLGCFGLLAGLLGRAGRSRRLLGQLPSVGGQVIGMSPGGHRRLLLARGRGVGLLEGDAGLFGGPPGPLQGPLGGLAGLLAPRPRRIDCRRRWWWGSRGFGRERLGCWRVGFATGPDQPGHSQRGPILSMAGQQSEPVGHDTSTRHPTSLGRGVARPKSAGGRGL
jgi:hypothetical protein